MSPSAKTRSNTFPHRLKAILASAVLALASSFWSSAQKATPATASANLPPGAMQNKATTACTECHDASIILQQRLGKPAWTKEVDKMIKWGAVVDSSDRDPLIEYLSTSFGPDQPPFVPPRTSTQKRTAGKTSK